jgi:hypothetical protein
MQLSSIGEPASRASSLLSKDSAIAWLPPGSQRAQPESAVRDLPSATSHSAPQSYDISVHTVKFVASPGKTQKLQSVLPVTIREVLRCAAGFAGCMVMISDQEARLVTVVTLWTGKERARHCIENASRVKVLLSPYVDDWLKSENHLAHFSLLSPLERQFQECCSSAALSTLNP